MLDTSELPPWEPAEVLARLEKHPLDAKFLRHKLDRLYMITSYNETEYFPDVVDVYSWIKLANELPQQELPKLFPSERIQKYFMQDFVSVAIKYMIICKKFKYQKMMLLTQQMMVEALRLFVKEFDKVEKYPKMTTIVKKTFEIEKQFYKYNFTNEYPFTVVPPTDEEVRQYDSFVENLRVGDKVDVFRTEYSAKSFTWLPGRVIRISSLSINVLCENEKDATNFDRKEIHVRPPNSMKEFYEWRWTLQSGCMIDFHDEDNEWVHAKITDKKQATITIFEGMEEIETVIRYIKVDTGKERSIKPQEHMFLGQTRVAKTVNHDCFQKLEWSSDEDNFREGQAFPEKRGARTDLQDEWISVSDVRVQKHQSIANESTSNQVSELTIEDFKDLIMDPNMSMKFVTRHQHTKSILFIQLLKYAHQQLHLFDKIFQVINEKSIKIETAAELINFVATVQPLFHRKFAIKYLNELVSAIFDYMNNSKESTIRNFSKERYETVYSSINEFLKRLKPVHIRKQMMEKFQLDLTLRFLFCDFLEKKLQAVNLLAGFFKHVKMNMTKKSLKDYLAWIKENELLPAIYNEKSHSELVSRSSEFLKFYLQTDPSPDELQSLLIWSEPILKLNAELFGLLPEDLQQKIVGKIKQKEHVTNPDALAIIKLTEGCESWLLKNGGQCWVEVVKEKSKKMACIAEVLKQPFPVVFKITKEVKELYECSLRHYYFKNMLESGYIYDVLTDKGLTMEQKLDFAALTLIFEAKISESIFEALLPFIVRAGQADFKEQYKEFLLSLVPKLNIDSSKQLFAQLFSSPHKTAELSEFHFHIFRSCFLMINENARNIDRKIKYEYASPHAYRKEKREIIIVHKKPSELLGIDVLLNILFHCKNIQVTMNAIELIAFLLERLSEELSPSVPEFEAYFLETCLNELYKVSENSEISEADRHLLQQKYLRTLQQIMNQSQRKGTDQTKSVNALFPGQNINIRVVDYFNTYKRRLVLSVPSNLTLHELKCEIGRNLNAYPEEMKMQLNGNELNNLYNGHVIHTLELKGDLVIEKKKEASRATLTDINNNLVDKAREVFCDIFKEYSSFGLMSKEQCRSYNKKCVSEISSVIASRVDKIYEEYDGDKDGYLTEADFVRFYENFCKTKEMTVWNHLQAFGVRPDLEKLEELPIVYAKKQTLTRYLLFNDPKFMSILLQLLTLSNQQLAKAAFSLLGRLPLDLSFDYDPDPSKQYLTRYWLYVIEQKGEQKKLTKQLLKQIFNGSTETICIALKVSQSAKCADEQIFKIIIDHLNSINGMKQISFYNQVLLDNALKVLQKSIQEDEQIKKHYLENEETYKKTLRNGILSQNEVCRTMYSSALEEILEHAINHDFTIFEAIFNLVYRIFDSGNRETLTIEYFELFSSLMESLRTHESLLSKLNLNWAILTQEMITVFKSHECAETGMNSKPDQVTQGLLRIIMKLLNQETAPIIVELVPYIFQNNLFPENSSNKIKNSKTRQDAYRLIYEVCKFNRETNSAEGLQKLFQVGFKDICKKMSDKKATETYSYYYYSYNEARSELGYAGLRNLGCICYMISMLQQFYMTVPFRHLVLMADDGESQCLTKYGSKEVDDNIFHQFQTLFAHLLLTEKQEYSPEQFCFAFKDFEGQPTNVSVQQDAQEFLNIFFDKIETSLKGTPFRHILENVYGGKTCSQMVCSSCNAIKERTQTFYPLSLEIKGLKKISESFEKYISKEVIQDYQCDKCQQKCDVEKRNFLEKTPNYFIIHLQRMCFNYDKFENEKVNSRMEFPHDLNVYDYTLSKEKGIPERNGEFTYKLRGIVLHYGTADFGHYFSYIRVGEGLWLEFNDERVREFDPSDIELECFGGEHWRRESQNAYLLVYEREAKSDLVLSFANQQEKKQYLSEFKLEGAVLEPEPAPQSQLMVSEGDQKGDQREPEEIDPDQKGDEKQPQEKEDEKQKTQKGEQKESEEKESNKQKTQTDGPKEEKRIQVHLDLTKVPEHVPKQLKEEISKENDQFSFSMNLSTDEFVMFIYQILSIDPPEELKPEFLELCYESFHLKKTVSDDENELVDMSEWAAKRFKELIGGHGWDFLKNYGKNWDGNILSAETSTRNVTKSLLNCVVIDIIETNRLNSIKMEEIEEDMSNIDRKDQLKVVIDFLDKLTDLMLDEVVRHWQRLKQYFELWVSLVADSQFVFSYCQQRVRMVDKILDFTMEEGYPNPRKYRRYTMGTQYYRPEFEYPLQLLHSLLNRGYKLNEDESKCLKEYSFLEKLVNHREQDTTLLTTVCKDNRINSERMGYIILNSLTCVAQSDCAKPIISSIHEYLQIADEQPANASLSKQRLQWILGFPFYLENERENSFGCYGIYPDSDPVITFISPLGAPSILNQTPKNKTKLPHVAALLFSMLLQLEHDGYINNLDQYPGRMCMEEHYTSTFSKFVESYYEDSKRTYIPRHFVRYARRMKTLWDERPGRPFTHRLFPRVLIGKTEEATLVSSEYVLEGVHVKQYDIRSHYLEIDDTNKGVRVKHLRELSHNENFISSKVPEVSGFSSYRTFMRLGYCEEDGEEDQQKYKNLFEKAKVDWLIRKIVISNEKPSRYQAVIKISNPAAETNIILPRTSFGVELKQEKASEFALIKGNLTKALDGPLKVEVKVIGKALKSMSWPHQLLTQISTPSSESEEDEQKQSSDEEDDPTDNYIY